jgi:hypothetical protein
MAIGGIEQPVVFKMAGAIGAQLEARAQQAIEIIAGKLDLDFKISLHRCPRAALKRW